MLFKVTKQYGRGAEIIANSFQEQAKARKFMLDEAAKDAHMKIQATYRLYEFDEVIEEVDTSKLDAVPHHKQAEATGGAGAGQQSGFRPTPLATAPKPKGSLHQKSDEEEDGK